MKKILIASLVVLTAGCSDYTYPTTPTVVSGGGQENEVSLGVASALMSLTSISSPVTSGPFSVQVAVTPGATYSFQLTHINGTVLHNHGFTATSSNMTVNMDYSTVPVGAYDLILMDNTGRVLKVAVIIQR